MKPTQNDILDKIIANRLKREYLEFNIGSGCYKITSITDNYATFKSCKRGCSSDKHSMRIYFDKDDMDDRILIRLLRKFRHQHVYIRHELQVSASSTSDKKPKRNKTKDIKSTINFINAFGKAYMSDVAEYIDSDPLYAENIFKALEKKGLVKEK